MLCVLLCRRRFKPTTSVENSRIYVFNTLYAVYCMTSTHDVLNEMNIFFKRNSLNTIYNNKLFENIIKRAPLWHIKKSFLDMYELYTG